MRRAAVALAALVALAAAPSALAWKSLSGGVQNIVIPSMLVTKAGTELVSWESPNGDTISVSRAGGAPTVVVSGDPIAGRTQLVQLPDGSIQLYFPNADGIGRLTSTNDGASWSGPTQTQSHDVGGVVGAAVGPDGTPYFSQDGTGFVNVFRGLNGDTVVNVFPHCCGYGESLAVDSTGLLQTAFYSNASAPLAGYVYEPLSSSLSPTATLVLSGGKDVLANDSRTPLVADASGNTYVGWAPGYPDSTGFVVDTLRGGSRTGQSVTLGGHFTQPDPHMALSVDSSDRLWAVWTGQGKIHVARSRSHGAHFGAEVTAALPGTAYQVSALGLPGDPGSVDVIVNTGSELVEQQLQPGLSVKVSQTVKKVGKKIVVTHWAQALDDGFGVPGATFTVGGKTVHGDGNGKARVPSGSGTASASGYAGARFRVP